MMFFDCNLSSVNPLEYVLMNNQECEVRPDQLLKQVNAVVVATISLTGMQNCVILVLLKI